MRGALVVFGAGIETEHISAIAPAISSSQDSLAVPVDFYSPSTEHRLPLSGLSKKLCHCRNESVARRLSTAHAAEE